MPSTLENQFSTIFIRFFALGGTREIRPKKDRTHWGSKAMRKTCFEVLPSSKFTGDVQERSPDKFELFFEIFCCFSSILSVGLRSGPDPGIFDILEAPWQE